ERKVILGAFHENELRGYGILCPESGDIAQIAVDKDYRRRGIGSLLLTEFAERAETTGKLSILNIDSSSKETLSFFESAGFENVAGQNEMMLEL
ncbi:MAG: GNAT family N-acetyltransferase, partial [Candidatus Bathyarchaeota archaeon]|nr:GNAT family N-acetyltransferase [Candidatus Bathyarchaeota archaeon]